jgi:hypothetical protein
MNEQQLIEMAKEAYPNERMMLALYLFVHVNMAGHSEQIARKEYALMKARTKLEN